MIDINIFDSEHQADLDTAIKLTQKVRYLFNKGVLPKYYYDMYITQIRNSIGAYTVEAEHEND